CLARDKLRCGQTQRYRLHNLAALVPNIKRQTGVVDGCQAGRAVQESSRHYFPALADNERLASHAFLTDLGKNCGTLQTNVSDELIAAQERERNLREADIPPRDCHACGALQLWKAKTNHVLIARVRSVELIGCNGLPVGKIEPKIGAPP